MAAYYNENDKFAAAWLRELIKAKLIADGEVDDRSIELVRPDDLRGFAQCHFFAGIGGWSYALRLAGWPDDRECWTGSCPCQPWSSAGQGAGADDPRDLWPAWFKLIRECGPLVVFGEQVAGAAGRAWLDRVHDNMEPEGYAIGPVDIPSAGVGAFDIRHRHWFVADATGRDFGGYSGGPRSASDSRSSEARPSNGHSVGGSGAVSNVAVSGKGGCALQCEARVHDHRQSRHDIARRRTRGDMADAEGWRCGQGRADAPGCDEGTGAQGPRRGPEHDSGGSMADTDGTIASEGRLQRSGPELQPDHNAAVGPWDVVEWLECRDGKARPIEPGLEPLAHGIPARLVRLRGYGNSINPWVAKEVIAAYMDIADG